MEKILIIGMSLNVGGAEKSLVNLLNMLDYDKYSVDLLLFQEKGAFLKQIPSEVHLVRVKEIIILFQSLQETLKMKGISGKDVFLALKRYIITFKERLKWKQFDQVRIHRWTDYFSIYIPSNPVKYDVGIAFAGGETTYYLVDKVTCKRKVCYYHSDYSQIDIDATEEEKYVRKVDQVITISEACQKSLSQLFPQYLDKITVLQNLSSPQLIEKLGDEVYPNEFNKNRNATYIVSVGRLHQIKGYDMAIKAASILRDNGMNFVWFVVGEGDERKPLERLIAQYHLEEQFILLGLRENPYPYMYNADVIVQPSRFEGKSIVLDEAKILKKPIVVTKYNSVEDQIKHNVTGIIVPMSAEGIADGLTAIIQDKKLQKSLCNNLISMDNSTVQDIEHYLEVVCSGKKV